MWLEDEDGDVLVLHGEYYAKGNDTVFIEFGGLRYTEDEWMNHGEPGAKDTKETTEFRLCWYHSRNPGEQIYWQRWDKKTVAHQAYLAAIGDTG